MNKFTTGDELIHRMREEDWAKAIVFGFAFNDPGLCKMVNDYTIKMINKYPEKLTGFAVVNPLDKNVERELKRCKEAGMKGVGELFPAGQNITISERNHLKTVCEFCRDNNWPLLIHLNEPVGHYYKGKTGDSVRKAEKLASNFPEVKFVFAHLGGGLCFYELMPEMREKLKNVYYDTAAQPFLYDDRIYKVLQEVGVIDKIILGSDYPLLPPARYLKSMKNSGLDSKNIDKILNKNLTRLMEMRRKH